MKNILVTGGAGFIGAHLIKKLSKKNSTIYCIDNLYTGSYKNFSDIKINPNKLKFIKHDVTLKFNKKIKFDQIWHLACPASPIHYQFNPVKTIKTSVIGSLNILELAKKNNCRVLLASTSEVYGDPKQHPQKEQYWGNVNPIGIRSCYDEGKRCAETLFFDYRRQFNLDIKVVRIFNTYGPKMLPNDGRVVSNFILQALNNENITIYGKGNQTRSFCYVDDLINGLDLIMKSKKSITGPINIGNPNEIKVKDLAKKIIRLTNSKSKIVYLPIPKDDPLKRKPDISLAKQALNWSPKINLENGLNLTIEHFKKYIRK